MPEPNPARRSFPVNKKSIVVLVVLILGAVLLGRRYLQSPASSASGAASGEAAGLSRSDLRPGPAAHPGEVPTDLVSWIRGTLWRNGLLESHCDSFLSTDSGARTRLWVDSSGAKPVWTVDLSGLDVAVLGVDPAYGDRLVDENFQANVRVAGTRLCSESERRRTPPGWSLQGQDRMRCAPGDGQKLVQGWFRRCFGRDPKPSELDARGEVLDLDIACRGDGQVENLGRLRSVRFSRLRLSHCWLSDPDALLLGELSVEDLELVDLGTKVLSFSGANVSKRLLVEGGDVKWVHLPLVCPAGGSRCDLGEQVLPVGLAVELRNLPLCDQGAIRSLRASGAIVDNPRCSEIPYALIERRDSLVAQWTRLKGTDISKVAQKSYDTISLDSRPINPDLDHTWSFTVETAASDDCNAGSYPRFLIPVDLAGSAGRIQDSYFEGPAIQATYKGQSIHAGMARQELIRLLGRPTVEQPGATTDGFLAWTVVGTCSGDLANLVAHFDANGQLDAWMDSVDPECGGC